MRAVFLDRDGVLIENRADYVKDLSEITFLPGACEAVTELASSSFRIFIVSNQSVVGRGRIPLELAMALNDHVVSILTASGGRIDRSYICPHRPEDACECRKPRPGMLLRAAADYGLDLAESYLVGDSAGDIMAAWNAGVTGIMVMTGLGVEQLPGLAARCNRSFLVAPDLRAAVDFLLAHSRLRMRSTEPERQRMADRIGSYVRGYKELLDSLNPAEIAAFVEHLRTALEEQRQVFVIGNGGSASLACHVACDLGKTVLGKRAGIGSADTPRFRVISLASNTALLSAWANDVSFDSVFSEQLRNLAQPGDTLMVITGSGNSPNILRAVEEAKRRSMVTLGLLGFDGGKVAPMLDCSICVRSSDYGHVEAMHSFLNHLITAIFKDSLAQPEAIS
ncbi:MAG: HAD-IIIA family hydrolase [Pseudomonadota bacterium]